MASTDTIDPAKRSGLLIRVQRWATASRIAFILAVAAAISGIATYIAFSNGLTDPEDRSVLYLLLVDLILLLLLGAIIARRFVGVWAARRSGLAGAKLHGRLVALFSLVAITPTIIVGVFSALYLDLGQGWFSDRVRGVLENSRSIAETYTEEHRRAIRGDVLAMANDLNNQATILSDNNTVFERVVSGQAALRNLFEAVVFNGSGEVLARANFGVGLGIDRLPMSALQEADTGEVVILTGGADDRVRALVRLERFFDTYLYVSRFIDPQVVAQAEEAITEYKNIEAERRQFHIAFTGIFIAVSLWILLIAVLVGLWMATRIVQPVSGLVMAAEKVREGNLAIRVAEDDTDDEISTLSRAFNRMASQLQEQRIELVAANHQLDERRRFTEAVLGGVTAGVLGLDEAGVINLPNRSALRMLAANEKDLVQRELGDAIPELSDLFEEARARPEKVAQDQVTIVRGGRARNLMVRISGDHSGEYVTGFVVTFDDITQLVTAQRTAAWADVARRIAHEIKNPLTPIQLSAERLRRRYARDKVGDDEQTRRVFDKCTDTIVRHVGDIRRMVDEFSAFARMPAPVFHEENLTDVVRRSVFSQEFAFPNMQFSVVSEDEGITLVCDSRLLGQALTNIVKNAMESIEEKEKMGEEKVSVEIAADEDEVSISIADTGVGLPSDMKDRLTEPYITTRAKGTGLGLAISRKIVEEHGGELVLEDRPGGGAVVRMAFSRAALAEIMEKRGGAETSMVAQ
jgi:two-component system nitrogen regulation sensor histidine kinase NtrY